MKRIIIELTDEQHHAMTRHISEGNRLNWEHETFSGFGICLNCCELGDWLEVDFYSKINLGEVNWKIE